MTRLRTGFSSLMLFASVQMAALLTPVLPAHGAEPDVQPRTAAADDFVYAAPAYAAAPVALEAWATPGMDDWSATPLAAPRPVLAPFDADDAWLAPALGDRAAFTHDDWFL